ncbi:MAG: ParA family protein [Gammaproteobacteria bacterium]|nr:ParA family protein [Gammaproteobacteria bacterium]
MRTILVVNAKGGSGKTTITTNLAGYLANLGRSVVIQDYDAQGSSTEWLAHRSYQLNQIHGQELYKTGSQYLTRAFEFRLPTNTQHVIVDTPAALDLQRNVGVFRKADKIIIPLSPSSIEVRATLSFIEQLKKFLKLYSCTTDIAIVANKTDAQSAVYKLMLQKFDAAGLKIITQLSQHDQYFIAAETGASIFELENPMLAKDKLEWAPLLNWVDESNLESTGSHSSNLYAVVE